MFLGLGATLLACFNFTGNVSTSGNFIFSNYSNYVLSENVSGGVDNYIEFVNHEAPYVNGGTLRYLLQYQNNTYEYFDLTIGSDLQQNPSINWSYPGTLSTTNSGVFSFDLYVRWYQYDVDDNLVNTKLQTFRGYTHDSTQFGFVDYVQYYRTRIEFTIAPYSQSMYNALIGYQPTDNYDDGYADGYVDGYIDGVLVGHNGGYEEGYTDGYFDGENSGYLEGLEDGRQEDETISTIASAIFQVATIPVNFFLAIFNYEIFGINLSSFISALLTIAVIVILFKTIFGGKSNND